MAVGHVKWHAWLRRRLSWGPQVSEHMKNRQERYDVQGRADHQGGRHSLARLEAQAAAAAEASRAAKGGS